MIETIEEWLKRIGSHEAMLERQRESLATWNRRAGHYKPLPAKPKPVVVIPTTPVGAQPKKKWTYQRGRSTN